MGGGLEFDGGELHIVLTAEWFCFWLRNQDGLCSVLQGFQFFVLDWVDGSVLDDESAGPLRLLFRCVLVGSAFLGGGVAAGGF